MRGRLILAALLVSGFDVAGSAQEQPPNRREFDIVAEQYRFTPNRLEVAQDDLVKITLRSADQPLSFAIDAYRIVKRVGAGRTVAFEFRADRPGTFAFYCSMASDDRCKDMRGTLVVTGR
ncbi:MAG: cupredoxin domain-containing protein [Acidobacteria bacterium]|nr:cupredoxin domain-containing protein [Acidobacteriota bacterium]